MSQKKINKTKNPIFVPIFYGYNNVCIRSGSFINDAIYTNSKYRVKANKDTYTTLGIRICLKRK